MVRNGWFDSNRNVENRSTEEIFREDLNNSRLINISGDIEGSTEAQLAEEMNSSRLLTNKALVDLANRSEESYQSVTNANSVTNRSIDLIWIDPGNFMLGSPETEQDRQLAEGPQTFVRLTRGFWLGKYEVTLAQYQEVVGRLPPDIPRIRRDPDLDRPVVAVSWENATNFCHLLNKREWENGKLPDGYEYRLPTEAEWEYACRAGATTSFSFGEDPMGSMIGAHAWYEANSRNAFHTVGMREPNAWGLFDMHGNVSEWCLDWIPIYPGGSVTDPIGIIAGQRCVLRGGWFLAPPSACRSAHRWCVASRERIINAGFRVALAPRRG